MFHVFPRAVPKKECERLLNYCIKNTNFSEASILNKGDSDAVGQFGRIDPRIRKTDIAFITPDDKADNRVNEIAWHFLTLANEIMFNYKFDIYQLVQFARYRDGGHYGWHQDINESGSLSDPKTYEGGHLEFYRGERPMEEQVIEDVRDQGSVIVFDSRDYHRVTPVTKGTRYSIVCWTVGPNFV
jgi:PKHD-type hydroxylase